MIDGGSLAHRKCSPAGFAQRRIFFFDQLTEFCWLSNRLEMYKSPGTRPGSLILNQKTPSFISKPFDKMRILYLIPLLLASCLAASAQTFENVIAITQGNKVLITYDLLSARVNEAFNVEVYGSHDNYSSPIKFVAGDIGANIKPGSNKRVEWSAEAELKKYKGDITFELRARPMVGRLSFRTPFVDRKVRRGKSAVIQWTGGGAMDKVKLNLYQGELLVWPITETLNSGIYSWSVPRKIKTGKDYVIRIQSGSETVNSPAFSIKPKTGAFVKLLPLFIAGGVAAFLLSDPGPDPPPPPPESLPVAPSPEGG